MALLVDSIIVGTHHLLIYAHSLKLLRYKTSIGHIINLANGTPLQKFRHDLAIRLALNSCNQVHLYTVVTIIVEVQAFGCHLYANCFFRDEFRSSASVWLLLPVLIVFPRCLGLLPLCSKQCHQHNTYHCHKRGLEGAN